MHNKNIFILVFAIISFSACSLILEDHTYDYLKETQIKDLQLEEDKSPERIVDYYPIPPNETFVATYEVPPPEQFFSSGTTNEIRLHKLGELRWVYIESLPSSVWPAMKIFLESTDYGINYHNPDTGVMKSNWIDIDGKETLLEMKVEHGIRQASSEIFVTHLESDASGVMVRVSTKDNLEEVILRNALDYLSDGVRQQGGTSLVALNLNVGKKATLRKNKDGSSIIQMNLEYARAWAAVDRALKEALISVSDLDRENGIFYVDFSKKKSSGFFRKIFSSRSSSGKAKTFKISVQEIANNKCIVTILDANQEMELSRDLLSEINQSLS